MGILEGLLFSEREIWGDEIDDLVSLLRRLIELKYILGTRGKVFYEVGVDQEESSIHR